MTPLTAEQYSELVVALEWLRDFGLRDTSLAALWSSGDCSDWCFVYLVQWFYKLGPLLPVVTHNHGVWICDHMVAELCEERTACAR